VIEAIAQRYHVTPSQAAREPGWTLRHMAIVLAVQPTQEGPGIA
jgi:hypothetical protein